MKRPVPNSGTVARTFGALVSVLASAACWADPGHRRDGGDWSLICCLSEPDQLVALLALALGAIGMLGLWITRARSAEHVAEHTTRRPADWSATAERAP